MPVFILCLWTIGIDTSSANGEKGSTSSRFCKHQRSEIVTIAPQPRRQA